MNHRGRFFCLGGIDEQADACDDEGDGEQLAHVQEHRLLELDLRLLDEFDQEAAAEAAQQEEAEEESAVHLVQLVLVDPDHDHAEQQVGEGLVQLGAFHSTVIP